jgi:competence protein ComGC
MDRLTSSKGFLLLEVCVAVMIIAVMTILYLPWTDFKNVAGRSFGDAYLEKQSSAICHREKTELEEDDISLSFNEKGNVNRAMTVQEGNQEIVIELGGGRLVYK